MKKLITPDDIVEGMILAEPVSGQNGQVLCAMNVKLEDKHKELFKSLGMDKIYVLIDDELLEKNADIVNDIDDIRTKAENFLFKRMKWEPRNNNERNLFEMGIESVLKNYF